MHHFFICFTSVLLLWDLQCDIVLDAAHRKSIEPSVGPRREDIVESIIFKSSDVVVVHFKDVDLNYAKKGKTCTILLFNKSFPCPLINYFRGLGEPECMKCLII